MVDEEADVGGAGHRYYLCDRHFRKWVDFVEKDEGFKAEFKVIDRDGVQSNQMAQAWQKAFARFTLSI